MSIVIANNDETGFYIISDTKITFNEDKYPCQIQEPLKSNIKKFGMLKTIIFRGCVALSFAGNDIRLIDNVISSIRDIMYSQLPATFEDVFNLVAKMYDNPDNINDDGTHKCDYILAFTFDGKVSLNTFKDAGIIKNIKKSYIGNADVYKDFCDLDLSTTISYPNCPSGKGILIDYAYIDMKFTPEGDLEQDTDEVYSKIRRLKNIVDLGRRNDEKHESNVGSPIIGVYYNTQRKQFEYYYDKVYEVHGHIPSDGKEHAINISLTSSGESYDIAPFRHTEGVIAYYHFLDYSVAYLCSDEYIKMGINDYKNLLLPIYFKGYIDESKFSPI